MSLIENREFIRDNFYLPKDLIYFNSGVYGICPKPVLEEKFKFLREWEMNPVMGYDKHLFGTALENLKTLAQKLEVNYQNLTLLQNVTYGINSVLQSIDVKDGDEILLTNFTYASVTMATESYFVGRGGKIQKLLLKPPFQSLDQIKNLYLEFTLKNPQIKYAIIDHIPSQLPMVQPVKEISRALREIGVFVIIDGAHSPGQLKQLNVADIGADVYIGNLHKWYFLPRPVGFLAVHPNCRINIKSPIISHLHEESLNLRFMFSGTSDITNMLCIKRAFEFIEEIGGLESISNYNTNLMKRGIEHLETNWQVKSLIFPEMAPFMRLIPYPAGFETHKNKIFEMTKNPFEKSYFQFINEHLGFNVATVNIYGELHFRICCQIFVDFYHFEMFAKKVLQWLEILESNENLL